MGQHFEIERKFLVKSLPPGWKHHRHCNILQGYFPVKGESIEIRLRKEDATHYITVKAGSGYKRIEEEIEIAQQSFKALWPLTRDARVSKTRYRIPIDDKAFQLDIYQGPHRGLVIAEIEFNSERESRVFQPPTWLGTEVTGRRRYTNKFLARKGGK